MSDVHYEVFARRPGGAMNLELTHDQEAQALRVGEEMFASGEFVGVRVVRETRDAQTGAFRSLVILKRGDQEEGKARPSAEEMGPVCNEPADLYLAPARAQIARLLEGWLGRVQATPFELLHRIDLVERLQNAGGELQHAIQKIAVPQSLGRGLGVHQVVRALQKLTDQAAGRLRADRSDGVFEDVTPQNLSAVCDRIGQAPDAAYRLAGGVADYLAGGEGWTGKVERLLDLADAAPLEAAPRAFAQQVLVQPLSEILASKAAMAELLGDLDLGGQAAAFVRLVLGDAANRLEDADPAAGALLPPLSAAAERVANQLACPGYEDIRRALARRLLQDVAAPRRLRPANPAEEAVLARALSLVLSLADPQIMSPEEVREAQIERSRLLVTQDFVEAFLRAERDALQEACDLADLMDGLTGAANCAQAMRWIEATVKAPRFEADATAGDGGPAARLAQLARLHRKLARRRGDLGGVDMLLERIVQVADRIEAEKSVARQLVRAQAPVSQKLGALLRMAAGETAPPGAAAARARTEAKRLLAAQDAMAELAKDPAAMKQLQTLIRAL